MVTIRRLGNIITKSRRKNISTASCYDSYEYDSYEIVSL